jgi:hypothetical protein
MRSINYVRTVNIYVFTFRCLSVDEMQWPSLVPTYCIILPIDPLRCTDGEFVSSRETQSWLTVSRWFMRWCDVKSKRVTKRAKTWRHTRPCEKDSSVVAV